MRLPLALAFSLVAAMTTDPLTHLLTRQQSGYDEPAEVVLHDSAEWQQAWRVLHGGTPETAAPAVDFRRDMIVLVALGARHTGGHTVQVTDVSAERGGAVVRYTVTEPGPGCMTAQVMSAPVDVVRAPRHAGTIRFVRRTVRSTC